MAVVSKPEETAQERKLKRVLDLLGPCVFLMVCEGSMLIQARPSLAHAITGKKPAETAKLLSSAMGAGALLEFLVNPVIGRLSDRYGRQPFLTSCIFGVALSRFSVFLNSKSRGNLILDRTISMALITSFFSTIRATQADILSSGSDLALAAGQIARWAGLGIFIGPYLDTILTRIGGSAKYSFLGASILAGTVGTIVSTQFTETLEEDKQKPVDLLACNPFAFVQMLAKSTTIRVLMIVSLLQTFGDGRNIQEVNTIFMKSHLKWSKLQISNMIAGYGAVVVIGALFVKQSLIKLGLKGHTSFSNLCQFLGSFLWGLAPASAPWSYLFTYSSLFASIGGQRKRDAVESIATKLAVETGMGKGQVAASLSNWRSIASILAPLLFGNTYAWATSNPEVRYIPGLPFFIVAAMTVLAEKTFRGLSDEELGIVAESDETVPALEKPLLSKGADVVVKTEVAALPGGKFLNKSRQQVTLKEKIVLSHDTRLFRFALPDPTMVLGLPVGKHIKFWCPNPKPVKEGEWNGRPDKESTKTEIERKYTPSSSDDDVGVIDVVIKVYKGGVIDRFPDGGKMSQHLESLSIGDKIDIAGPLGLIEYTGKGTFLIKRKPRKVKYVGMISGGTGITPMLQLIQSALKDPEDTTKFSLLFANQTEEDILVRDMLEKCAKDHPTRFKIWYTLDRPPADWGYSKGFIDADMIRSHLPPPSAETIVLMCGPPPMLKFACIPNLEKLGYEKGSYMEF